MVIWILADEMAGQAWPPSGEPGVHMAQTYLAELADAEVLALRVRYRFGQTLRGEYETQGPQIIARISGVLRHAGMRFDRSAVRKLRRIAGVIRPDEFEELLTLRGPSGLPLRWSHIELLSCVPSRRERLQRARQIAAGNHPFRVAKEMTRQRARRI